MKKITAIFIFYFAFYTCYSQVADVTNYPLIINSNAALVDMTDGTMVQVNEMDLNISATPISFGGSFNFCLMGECFDSISIFPKGAARLGNHQYGINDIVSSPFYDIAAFFKSDFTLGTNGFVKYKLIGTYPNRKFVIHWKANLTSTSTTANADRNFQLWLSENGRIDYVFENLPTSFNFNSYKIGFAYPFGSSSYKRVDVDVQTPFSNTIAVYGSYISNSQSIPDNTIFSFIPDTIKVNKPLVNFNYVESACLEISILDSTKNENFFSVLKSTDGINYHEISTFNSIPLDSGTFYTLKEEHLNENTRYYYAVISKSLSNKSDTVYIDTVTSFPQLSGVRTIPGDYSSITEALEDIKCRKLAGSMTLELTEFYNTNLESFPLVFDQYVNSDSLKSLTIRPSLTASNILISNSSASSVIEFINSKNVNFIGKSGGVLETSVIEIANTNPLFPAIKLGRNTTNISFLKCNILGKGDVGNEINVLVYFDSVNVSYNKFESCIFKPIDNNSWLEIPIYSVGKSYAQNFENQIKKCYFTNFGYRQFKTGNNLQNYSGIYLGNGNSNWEIDNCHFYFTDTFQIKNWFININTVDGGEFKINNNFFGGSSNYCQGNKMIAYASDIRFIYLKANALNSSEIQFNQIKNLEIYLPINSGANIRFIESSCFDIKINDNKIGDTTILGDIHIDYPLFVYKEFLFVQSNGLSNIGSNHEIKRNYFANTTIENHSKLTSFLVYGSNERDQLIFEDNVIGSSLPKNINTGGFNGLRAVMGGEDSISIYNNEIRNVYSKSIGLTGLYITPPETPSVLSKNHLGLIIKSNKIYNLENVYQGSVYTIDQTNVQGISYNSTFGKINIIGNKILNLTCKNDEEFPIGNGIYMYAPNAHVSISNNEIKNICAIKGITPKTNGINLYYGNYDVFNNMIFLGNDEFGNKVIDSCEVYGINVAYQYVNDTINILNNSIYLTGNNGGLHNYQQGSCLRFYSNSNINIYNNILATERKFFLIDFPTSFESIHCDYNQYYKTQNTSVLIAKNGLSFYYEYLLSITDFDENSFFRPPMFVNATGTGFTSDLHLQTNNYSESRGIEKGIIYDIDGDNRSLLSPIDIGADAGNFHQLPLVNIGNDSTICSNSSITIFPNESFESYLWNTGDTTFSIEVNTGGTYYLTVTDSLGYQDSDTIIIYNDTLIPNFTVFDDKIICQNGNVNLTTVSGFSNYLWNTSETTTTIIVNTPGNYTVSFENLNHCSFFDTINVFLDTIYNYTYSDQNSICSNDSLLFSTFPYNNNLGNDTLYFLPNTNNIIEINSNFCSIIDTIYVVGEQYIDIIDVNLCQGDSIFIDNEFRYISGIYFDSLLSTNGCDSIIEFNVNFNSNSNSTLFVTECLQYTAPDNQIYTSSGTYTAIIPNNQGCDSTITINLTITNFETSVIQIDSVLSSSTNDATSYQWIDCLNGNQEIVSETNQSFVPFENGEFAVVVTNDNCSDTSDCFIISNIGVQNQKIHHIDLYPNPSSKQIAIDFGEIISNSELKIYSITGNLIENIFVSNIKQLEIDIEHYSKGMYFIEVSLDSKNNTIKFIKD